MLEAADYFDLNKFRHKEIFQDTNYVWEAVGKLEEYIAKITGLPYTEIRKRRRLVAEYQKEFVVPKGCPRRLEHLVLETEV